MKTGHIAKYGVDIGYLQGGVIVWGVVAPTADLKAGALAGDYGGTTGGASVGSGSTPMYWSAASSSLSRCSR